ncbi:unnamed protein product [Rhizoctonia solani]|uniref:Uncharacterized protein n=1 Tax=Rhizoctonia solani TaxID=456999 RepID=A0A8H3DDA1_9AGAM|nr:unnamed protein product [Rhizoctonia solani]
MGIPAHSRWGPPLEQYVLRYDKTSIRGRPEMVNPEIMTPARTCLKAITTISEEADEIKFESLAKKADEIKFESLAKRVTLEMLRSLWLLSLSGQGALYFAQPRLIRGCLRLMKIIKVDGLVSPFSYEYGYLCFNIGKMALGVCLVEKFHSRHLANLMNDTVVNCLTKDTPSILTEYLSMLFLDEPKEFSQGMARCDWIFGWSDPPAHGGHSELIIAGSDVLDLMNVLWNDRKVLLKALSSAYTPGASIMLLPSWQYLYRMGISLQPVSRTPLLDAFLDLTWRFTLIATPGDYGLILPIIMSAMFQSGRLPNSAVDVEDSRNIIEAYVRGLPPAEDALLYRQMSFGAYPFLPRFVAQTLLPGTEDLYIEIIKSMLGRLWEMLSWGQLGGMISPVAAVVLCFDDVMLFLRFHGQSLQYSRSPVLQAIIEELANNDILGLIGFAINRLYTCKDTEANETTGYIGTFVA